MSFVKGLSKLHSSVMGTHGIMAQGCLSLGIYLSLWTLVPRDKAIDCSSTPKLIFLVSIKKNLAASTKATMPSIILTHVHEGSQLVVFSTYIPLVSVPLPWFNCLSLGSPLNFFSVLSRIPASRSINLHKPIPSISSLMFPPFPAVTELWLKVDVLDVNSDWAVLWNINPLFGWSLMYTQISLCLGMFWARKYV